MTEIDLNEYSLAEKLETIISTRASGQFGTIVEVGDNLYRVTTDGKTFLVSMACATHNWIVRFCGIAFSNASLDETCWLAHDFVRDLGDRPFATRNVAL